MAKKKEPQHLPEMAPLSMDEVNQIVGSLFVEAWRLRNYVQSLQAAMAPAEPLKAVKEPEKKETNAAG